MERARLRRWRESGMVKCVVEIPRSPEAHRQRFRDRRRGEFGHDEAQRFGVLLAELEAVADAANPDLPRVLLREDESVIAAHVFG